VGAASEEYPRGSSGRLPRGPPARRRARNTGNQAAIAANAANGFMRNPLTTKTRGAVTDYTDRHTLKASVNSKKVAHHRRRQSLDWPPLTGWASGSPALGFRSLKRKARSANTNRTLTSGVLHSGLYYKPGSLRARLAVAGIRQMAEFCRENGIAHEICGKLVVAADDSEVPRLRDLEKARRRQRPGRPALAGSDEMREIEPHVGAWRPARAPGRHRGLRRGLRHTARPRLHAAGRAGRDQRPREAVTPGKARRGLRKPRPASSKPIS